MKILRNRLFIGLLCVVLSIVFVFVAAPAVTSAQNKRTEVCQAVEDIAAGATLTSEMLRTTNIPVSMAPENAIKAEDCIGKRAVSAIWTGDIMTSSKLAEGFTPEDTYSLATAKQKMVISITMKNLSVMAAARIQPGDVVTVMALPNSRYGSNSGTGTADSTGLSTGATAEPEETEETPDDETSDYEETTEPVAPMPEPVDITEIEPSVVIYPELKYMEIAAIVARQGQNAKVDTEPGEDEENSLPVTVSFYATEQQAMRLAELEKNGTAYIAFVARGEQAFAFIPEIEKVLIPEKKDK
jgi:pilus assembly protein CpaB